jgi:hypothetical protein
LSKWFLIKNKKKNKVKKNFKNKKKGFLCFNGNQKPILIPPGYYYDENKVFKCKKGYYCPIGIFFL